MAWGGSEEYALIVRDAGRKQNRYPGHCKYARLCGFLSIRRFQPHLPSGMGADVHTGVWQHYLRCVYRAYIFYGGPGARQLCVRTAGRPL